MAKGDSAASQNYWRPQDTKSLKNIRSYSGTPVIFPDADTLTPSQQGTLEISNKLSQLAQTATVLPELKSPSLISLGQICDNNCTIVLNKTNLIAAQTEKIKISVHKDDIIMSGSRNKTNSLYDILIHPPKVQTDNYFIQTIFFWYQNYMVFFQKNQ